MKKILITGGAGYIGSILTEDLIKLGYTVTVIDNFLYNQSSLNHLYIHRNLNVVNGDVRDERIVLNHLKTADIIIPLAALVGAPICNKDPIGSKTINTEAIIMLFKNLSKDQWVIMPTTNSAYGTGDKNNYCDETSPLKPISLYAKEKVEIENRLMDIENVISFRLATVFGLSPRMRTDLLVNDFIYRAVRDGFIVVFEGNFKRNYIHVRDVSNVFVHALNFFETMKNNIYNVGLSDANLSKIELCEIIKSKIPKFVYFEEKFMKDIDQRNYIVSNKKIEETGFNPTISLSEGIDELIKGFKVLSNNKYSNI